MSIIQWGTRIPKVSLMGVEAYTFMHMGSQVHLYSRKPAKDTDADSSSYETPPKGSVDLRILRERCSLILLSIWNSLNYQEQSFLTQSLSWTSGLWAKEAQQGRELIENGLDFSRSARDSRCIYTPVHSKTTKFISKCCDISRQWICLEGFYYLCHDCVFNVSLRIFCFSYANF